MFKKCIVLSIFISAHLLICQPSGLKEAKKEYPKVSIKTPEGGCKGKEEKTRNPQNPGNNKRKIVTEEDLENYADWEIEAPLPSGKIAIRRR